MTRESGDMSQATEVIHVRITAAQKALIDNAARLLGKSRTAFILDLAVRHAEGVLAEKTHFQLSSKIPLWFETSPFRGKRVVDKTAEPMKSFSVTPPFREGRSARPLSVGCGVSRRTGRLWIETSEQWNAFTQALDAPVQPDPALVRLLNTPAPWET